MKKKDIVRFERGYPVGDVVCQREGCDTLIAEDERFIDHDYCYECVCADCEMPLTEADKQRGDKITCGACENELVAKINELDMKGLCHICEREPKDFDKSGCAANICKKCQADETWFWEEDLG